MDAIVAVYADWGIGAKGTQPLVIPADRRRFRALTMGAAVIVGRRTLDDFPGGRPLPGRENLVLTRQNITIEGAQVVHSPAGAVAAAARYDHSPYGTHLRAVAEDKLVFERILHD